MTPYFERNGVTLYHGDALELLPALVHRGQPGQLVAPERVVLITDPVWPDAPAGMFPGVDAWETMRRLGPLVPQLARRAVFILGCTSDPRILAPLPAEYPFVRQCSLRWDVPVPRGTVLNGHNVAYVYGSAETAIQDTRNKHYNFRGVLPGEVTVVGQRGRGRKSIHPCPRDLDHMRWLIFWFTRPGDLVIDPFAGDCTTLRAAWEHGRRAVGIELVEDYCASGASQLDLAMNQGQLPFHTT